MIMLYIKHLHAHKIMKLDNAKWNQLVYDEQAATITWLATSFSHKKKIIRPIATWGCKSCQYKVQYDLSVNQGLALMH